ncbi:hypothetical protein [Pontibacter fetidus]|uniref:Uncharacterized protein n=1 Tax=Pontibacter fetidus TaxID=2700082 RepID=A0A6B2H081_9BACT|nr:hypothetical protein [Pontibacter fetidus]NDK55723.1 hypothetical protein [Pontibacter fetidus]
MKIRIVTSGDYRDYLMELLGREPAAFELFAFERNQNLLRITKRQVANDIYHITFTNGTGIKLVTDGIVQGGDIQLHSLQEEHRFYTVFLEAYGIEEEQYLMLDAAVKTICLDNSILALIQGVQLITMEDLLTNYSPVFYNLD